MWPWESAFTGCDCVPTPDPEGRYEQHITGDIVVAFRQYWYATMNVTWLQQVAKPVIDESCTFFECRATIAPEYGVPQSKTGCGAKRDFGNYTMLFVQPPDESAGVINSSAYESYYLASFLLFCFSAFLLFCFSLSLLFSWSTHITDQ